MSARHHAACGARMGLLALLLACAATARAADADRFCPPLPAAAHFVWSHYRGPDFDVCHALRPGSDSTVFGIYFGWHPSFNPARGTRLDPGVVGGRPVTWFVGASMRADGAFAQQTLIELTDASHAVAHVWIDAASQEELAESLRVLAQLSLESSRPLPRTPP